MFEKLIKSDRKALQHMIELTAQDVGLSQVFLENTALHDSVNALEQQIARQRETLETLDDDIQRVQAKHQEKAKALTAITAQLEEKEKLLDGIQKSADILLIRQDLLAQNESVRQDTDALRSLQHTILSEIENHVEDNRVASWLPSDYLTATNVWKNKIKTDTFSNETRKLHDLSYNGPTDKKLINQLVERFKSVRNYDRNTVINLYICIIQNFLTVFAGEPGAGKLLPADLSPKLWD